MANEPIDIHASPTKLFFVSMLTRDIGLSRAIIDLVDNSVDGCLKNFDADFSKGEIHLTVEKSRFIIKDNCGGIPLDIAKDYAFRFGRTVDTPNVAKSIGQFGVGMKRAIFKMGETIEIKSLSTLDRFTLLIKLEEWLKDDDNWDFLLTDYERFQSPSVITERGTSVSVSDLHESISKLLGDQFFVNQLMSEISNAHRNRIEQGLVLTVNQIPLLAKGAKLFENEIISPSSSSVHIDYPNGTSIDVHIICGIEKSSQKECGWYVFCNGREVLGADKTLLTGWGEDDGKSIPRYHPQFNRFRGYVFFASDDAKNLPWNTTKTGVDADSEIYRSTRLKMIAEMRPVIDFLNELDREKDYEQENQVLTSYIDDLKPDASKTVQPGGDTSEFRVNKESAVATKPKQVTISYKRDPAVVDAVKKALNVTTNRDVGERTFDYFLNLEVDD